MSNCIHVTTGRTATGYGVSRLNTGGKVWFVYAHRFVYEQAHGPIPNGMQVCHTCDNPSCINIEHLFLGTAKDNAADRDAKGRRRNQNDLKTQCIHGHEFSPENTWTDGRRRQCKTCLRNRKEQYRA